jgi:uncharacterized protein YjgD (DUF1641 family)
MDKNPNITGSHDKYLTLNTADLFLAQSDILKDKYGDLTNKTLERNNNIKHLVLSFHHQDKERFDEIKDSIIDDLYQELGIDPETHLSNIFVHNDKGHPHIHVLFSRVGQDQTVFNDQQIGKRMGEFAKKMNKKYNLHHPEKNNSKVTIDKKYLYKPTYRGDLLKVIDYATKEADSLVDFQNILRRHGVQTKINNNSEIIYMLPNLNAPNKEEVKSIIDAARKNSKTPKEFKDKLQKQGVFIKVQKDGKESFSVKKVIAWNEDTMPKACRLNQLYRNIKTNKHDKAYFDIRNLIKDKIDSCQTLGQIQDILPGCEMTYDVKGTKIYNIQIHYEDYSIRLNEAFTKEVQFVPSEIAEYMKIPIIFTNRQHDNSWDKTQEYLAKKHNNKRKPKFKI